MAASLPKVIIRWIAALLLVVVASAGGESVFGMDCHDGAHETEVVCVCVCCPDVAPMTHPEPVLGAVAVTLKYVAHQEPRPSSAFVRGIDRPPKSSSRA